MPELSLEISIQKKIDFGMNIMYFCLKEKYETFMLHIKKRL